jgi:hypothetical protein
MEILHRLSQKLKFGGVERIIPVRREEFERPMAAIFHQIREVAPYADAPARGYVHKAAAPFKKFLSPFMKSLI